ncbi:MAG: hypothetical protein ABIG20_01945 [archaeon]
MKSAILPVFAMLLVLLTSGCISAGEAIPIVAGSGVGFTQFYPVAPEVYEGNDINLYMQIQNNGYFTAKDVNFQMYSCGALRNFTYKNINEEKACNDIMEFDLALDPPDRELGIAGEMAEAELAFHTTNLNFPAGRSVHTIYTRLEYGYEAVATRDIVLTSFDNWREKNGVLDMGALTAYTSPGPITLSIKAPNAPIVISDSSNEQEFTIALSIANTGGGNLVPQKVLKSIDFCYDPEFLSVADPKDFKSFEVRDKGNKKCFYVDDDEFNNEDLRTLTGLQQQWEEYEIQFKTNTESLYVQNLIQDITTFDATVTYRYAADASTQITIVS